MFTKLLRVLVNKNTPFQGNSETQKNVERVQPGEHTVERRFLQFGSRSFTTPQDNYIIVELELVRIQWG